MTRRPDHIPKRKPFPKPVRLEILKRSGGMCEMPGCKKHGKEFDHYPKPVAKGGESTLENGRLLCHECNATTGVQTAKDVAKADRQAGRSGQYARRKRNGSKLKSRGFQGSRKFNGEVTWKTK